MSLDWFEAKAGGNLLDAATWRKPDHPFFTKDAASQGVSVQGITASSNRPMASRTGSSTMPTRETGQGCENHRSPRAQPFTWNADGTPNFGRPVPLGEAIAKPSGTAKSN